MQEFKVGDEVEVITKRHGEIQFGLRGIIVSIHGRELSIKIKYHMKSTFLPDYNYYSSKDLELVVQELQYDPSQQLDLESDV